MINVNAKVEVGASKLGIVASLVADIGVLGVVVEDLYSGDLVFVFFDESVEGNSGGMEWAVHTHDESIDINLVVFETLLEGQDVISVAMTWFLTKH